MNYLVKHIELYLSEVGDGDPDLQFTDQEEYVMHQRCLGRWKAKNEKHLKTRIEDFIGYSVETISFEELKS
tara:strand:- start:372 stop:584 length:213 start_codon:yes stop_codon:yes gene_type:complete